MYISTNMYPFQRLGSAKAIVECIKSAGFTAYDFSAECMQELVCAEDYLERAKDLRAYADKIGIVCNQSHAPFPVIKEGDEEYNVDVHTKILRTIEMSTVFPSSVCQRLSLQKRWIRSKSLA